MLYFRIHFFFLLACFLPGTSGFANQKDRDIGLLYVKRASKIWSPDSAELMIQQKRQVDGKTVNFEIMILKAEEPAMLAEFLAPPPMRGHKFLLKEDKIWTFNPDRKRVVSVGQQEAMSEPLVSLYFVLHANFWFDVDTMERKEGTVRVTMKSSKGDLNPFKGLEYIIEERGGAPVGALLTSSEDSKVFEVTVVSKQQFSKRSRPSKVQFTSSGDAVEWTLKSVKEKKLSSSIFSKASLKR